MKNALLVLSLTILVGCNEDAGSNRRRGNGEKAIPQAETTNFLVTSYVIRDSGNPVLTTQEEITLTLTNGYTDKYRFIPVMATDNESVRSFTRPTTTCGIGATLQNIDERIADCATLNSTRATFSGSEYGRSGEATWRLVARQANAFEIWLDTHTGLVWSDVVQVGNWCQASGNNESATTTESISCVDEGAGENVCSNLSLEGFGNNIKWRLPTRNDFLQAELDGIRYIKKPTDIDFWTATTQSNVVGRNKAWIFSFQLQGTLISDTMNTGHQIKCIGAPVRK